MQNKEPKKNNTKKPGKPAKPKMSGQGRTKLERLESVLEELDCTEEIIPEKENLALAKILDRVDRKSDSLKGMAKKKKKTPRRESELPKKRKDKVRRRIREWKEKGFDTARLDDIFSHEPQVVARMLQSFDRDVKTLQGTARHIMKLEQISGDTDMALVEKMESIKRKLGDPGKVVEVLTELSELESLINFKYNSLI